MEKEYTCNVLLVENYLLNVENVINRNEVDSIVFSLILSWAVKQYTMVMEEYLKCFYESSIKNYINIRDKMLQPILVDNLKINLIKEVYAKVTFTWHFHNKWYSNINLNKRMQVRTTFLAFRNKWMLTW